MKRLPIFAVFAISSGVCIGACVPAAAPVEVAAPVASVRVTTSGKTDELPPEMPTHVEISEVVVAEGGGDPRGGRFTMDDVRRSFSGPLTATISVATDDPDKGRVETTIQCQLLDEKAPNTVANFVGLAQGLRPFKEASGRWVTRAAYDGTPFHRIIRGFMIQGGDITQKNGSGEPGYVIPDENWPGAAHDRAGLLCMANRGADTNGAQFFITDAAVPHLDGGYTIFGECGPLDAIHALASATTGPRDRPEAAVMITSIRVAPSRAH